MKEQQQGGTAQQRYEEAHEERRKKFRRTNGPNAADANRPVIRLRGGELHEIASEAEAALIGADAPFYTRGGAVVRPIVEEVAASKGRRTKVARLKPVTVDLMRDYLSRVAQFEKSSARSKKTVVVDPPHDVAKIILERDGEWGFRPLAGIITTPTLRPDGTVLCTPGYDPATRLLLLAPPAMPILPESPTRGPRLSGRRLSRPASAAELI